MAAQIVSRLKMEGNNMAIGERIRFIRNLRGMTQKFLGLQVGFSERTADIRMAQYESGSRTPKADLVEQLADALDVSTEALNVPNIDRRIDRGSERTEHRQLHRAYAHAVCFRGLIRLQDRPSGRRNMYPHQQAERLDLCKDDRSARTLGGNGSEVPQWGNQP